MSETSLTAVVPTYNEADGIVHHLRYHSDQFDFRSIMVVDGGSTDGTFDRVNELDPPIEATRITPGNRARQLAEGVRRTDSGYLLFLHADTYLPESFSVGDVTANDAPWGWFDCELDDSSLIYETIGTMITLRSALFSSPTGDQAIWVKRSLLKTIGGIPRQPLMEDVELSRRLAHHRDGRRITKPVTTSSRRWKDNGTVRTILTMWGLKVGYYLGIAPETLAKLYYGRTETTEN